MPMPPRNASRNSAKKLLAWYDQHGRDLPWRKTHDPYKILVSEIMLQQTQVSRVLFFYKAWLKKFPTWKALASASNGEVIHAWAGLGYNRRALVMRDIAKHIVAKTKNEKLKTKQRLNTKFQTPKTEDEWLTLKGIGPYTAAAVALFSGNEATVPIDTNIRRVWGRVLLGKTFPGLENDEKLKKQLGGVLEKERRRADFFQATFDLATSICTKQPECAVCPLKAVCPASKAFLSGKAKAPKRTTPISNERIHASKKYPDRIFRGRILKALREAPRGLAPAAIGPLIDQAFDSKQDSSWLEAMIARLERDGMLRLVRGKILLHE